MTTTESEHDWFSERIAAYLAGGLEGEERAGFEAHAQRCAACAAELSEAKQLEKQMTDLFAVAMPGADFEDRLIGRLRFSSLKRRRLRIHPLVRKTAIAAAAAIVLGGFGLVGQEYIEHGKLPTLQTLTGKRPGIAMVGGTSLGYETRRGFSADTYQVPSSKPDKLDFGGGANTSIYRSSLGVEQEQAGRQLGESNDYKLGLPFVTRKTTQVHDVAGFPTKAKAPSFFRPGEMTVLNTSAISQSGGNAGLLSSPYDANDNVLLPTDEPADHDRAGKEPAQPATAGAVPATQPVGVLFTSIIEGRKVIREGTIEFEVDSFDSAFATISKITTEEGGFVAAADSDKLPNGKVRGSITVRVPPDHLDTLVLKLRALGELKSQRLGSKDISKEYTDLESELRAAKAMEERLLEMIKTAQGKVKELLEAEKELGNWRAKIEKIQGTINYYNNLVSMATLTINAYEKDIKTPASATQTEEINTGLETDDVEHARAEAIKAVDDAKGRIIESELKQLEAGQLAAKVVAEVAPDQAGPIVDRLRQLGKIARLDIQRKQTDSPAQGTGSLGIKKIEQSPTRLIISMYNLANVAPRLTTNVNLAGEDVETTYRAILARIAKASGRVISSNLNRSDATQATGTIQFEVKSAEADAVLNDVRTAGQVLQLNVTENPDTANVTTAKQAFTLQIIPAAQVPPRETRTLSLQTSQVEAAVQTVNAAVSGAGGRITESNLSQDGAGRSAARLVIDVPLAKADQLVDSVRKQGTVRTAESSKNAQIPEGSLSRARLNLSIGSGEGIVSGEQGFWTSIREGLGTSVRGLLWSLQLIVIGVCLVAPWALLLWGGWKLLRRGKGASAAT